LEDKKSIGLTADFNSTIDSNFDMVVGLLIGSHFYLETRQTSLILEYVYSSNKY